MKLAVIVPAPFIVAVVDGEPELAKVIDGVSEPQDENVYPEFAVADIESGPASYQVFPEGLVVPLPEGLTAKVTWY
jgi:hypothetical protein